MYEPASSTRADIDSQGKLRYRHEIVIDLPESMPAIAPGEYMYIHIRPLNWTTTNPSTAVLLWATGSYFTPVMEGVSTYVNIFNENSGVGLKSQVSILKTLVGRLWGISTNEDFM